ncbi:hypothetical protein CAP35_11870 [Chitinophagaceae bacterium IBVUCB1]|nr:hypothetical protein CAP35_11870 [Chitinophagaceae bacterium IBVUCB1]
MMKHIYTLATVLAACFCACNKADNTPRHSLQLHTDSYPQDVAIENIEAVWNNQTGNLNLYADGTEHQILKMNINTLQTTRNTVPSIADVYYAEDDGFAADSVTSGEISITAADDAHAEGTLHATFANQARTDTKTISAHFIIYRQL